MKALITRSEPGASRMAREFSAAGVDSYVCPLLLVEPTHQPLPDDCFDKVIFVSEHAVSYSLGKPDELLNALAEEAQWYAIGPSTGAAVAAAVEATVKATGLRAPAICVPEEARSEGLLEDLGLQSQALVNGPSVLIVAGEGGRALIADTLRTRGASVHSWLVYRRVPVSTDKLVETLGDSGCEFDVCVASSGSGLELLASAWFAAGGGAEVPVCVPSPRILELATALGWRKPVLCDGASAQATLAGLVEAGLLDKFVG